MRLSGIHKPISCNTFQRLTFCNPPAGGLATTSRPFRNCWATGIAGTTMICTRIPSNQAAAAASSQPVGFDDQTTPLNNRLPPSPKSIECRENVLALAEVIRATCSIGSSFNRLRCVRVSIGMGPVRKPFPGTRPGSRFPMRIRSWQGTPDTGRPVIADQAGVQVHNTRRQ